MSESFIVRRGGGGGSKLFAAIGVTYPADQTCTCTKGTKTLTSKATNGQWVFPIPEDGKWTVLAGTKSKEVDIGSPGQCVVVNLKDLHLFKAGVGLATGYSIAESGTLTADVAADKITLTGGTGSTDGQAYFSPAIDCSQYSKLTVTARKTKFQDQYSRLEVRLLSTETAGLNEPAVKTITVEGWDQEFRTVTVDLTDVNEPVFLNTACWRSVSAEITDILFT